MILLTTWPLRFEVMWSREEYIHRQDLQFRRGCIDDKDGTICLFINVQIPDNWNRPPPQSCKHFDDARLIYLQVLLSRIFISWSSLSNVPFLIGLNVLNCCYYEFLSSKLPGKAQYWHCSSYDQHCTCALQVNDLLVHCSSRHVLCTIYLQIIMFAI